VFLSQVHSLHTPLSALSYPFYYVLHRKPEGNATWWPDYGGDAVGEWCGLNTSTNTRTNISTNTSTSTNTTPLLTPARTPTNGKGRMQGPAQVQVQQPPLPPGCIVPTAQQRNTPTLGTTLLSTDTPIGEAAVGFNRFINVQMVKQFDAVGTAVKARCLGLWQNCGCSMCATDVGGHAYC
jgi:hypothetical protein